MDVSLVALATIAGVFCGLTGMKSTRELNMRLQKIDNSLHSFSNSKIDRLRVICTAILPLAAITILLTTDIGTWIRKNEKEGTEYDTHFYTPFFSLYCVLTVLHIILANTVIGLGVRYSRLNLMLKSSFLTDTESESAGSKQKITTVKSILPSSPLTLHGSLLKLNAEHMNDAGDENKGMLIKLLAENHESLTKCVALVSNSYGIAMLCILVSCLLHLVATAYFLFLDLLSKTGKDLILLQILWIAFHIFRLLMIVQPCHMATFESKRTIHIVCEIERKVNDPILVEEINKFWQQLLVLDAEFSACGMCRVNRTILTSLSGAICTYLVILIQFQNTNG